MPVIKPKDIIEPVEISTPDLAENALEPATATATTPDPFDVARPA
jgi:hypothetical protein